jgi:hypothetical protein
MNWALCKIRYQRSEFGLKIRRPFPEVATNELCSCKYSANCGQIFAGKERWHTAASNFTILSVKMTGHFAHKVKAIGGARVSRSASVPPTRRSARLAGEPPDHDLSLSRSDYWTPEGLYIESTVVHNRTKGRWEGDWAFRVKKESRKKAFYLGQIVMATDPHPQTILSRKLTDREVAQTICGPISAKMRAMVVINLTCNGLLCLPMYTHSKNNNLSQARYEELVSISQSYTWPGKTPWAGLPLHMTLRGNYASISFIELLQPVHILAESSINDIGFIPGGEFAKLMRLLTYRETQARKTAFQVYGEPYIPSFMWKPTPGKRTPYTPAKGRMQNQTLMRW